MASTSITDDLNKAMFAALVSARAGSGGDPSGVFQAEFNKLLSQAITQAYSA